MAKVLKNNIASFTPSRLYKKTYNVSYYDGSLSPITYTLQTLTKRDLEDIRSLSGTVSSLTIHYETLLRSLKTVIGFVQNGMPVTENFMKYMSVDIIKELADFIYRMSSVDDSLALASEKSLAILFESKFNTDTWNCEVCKQKRLDKQRNCRYREDYPEKKADDFMVYIGTTKYTECPMYDKDNTLIQDLLDCYSSWEKGILIDEGGLYDQTEFFVYSSRLVNNKLKAREAEALEETRSKTKG